VTGGLGGVTGGLGGVTGGLTVGVGLGGGVFGPIGGATGGLTVGVGLGGGVFGEMGGATGGVGEGLVGEIGGATGGAGVGLGVVGVEGRCATCWTACPFAVSAERAKVIGGGHKRHPPASNRLANFHRIMVVPPGMERAATHGKRRTHQGENKDALLVPKAE